MSRGGMRASRSGGCPPPLLSPRSPAGCGTEMTKQRVTSIAGDPDYGAEKQQGGSTNKKPKKKKKIMLVPKDVSH